MNQVAKIEEEKLPPKMGALTAGAAIRAIVPQTLDDVYRLANMVVRSGLAPDSFKTAEAVSIALMHGLEVGFPPMMALQSIAVINKRPTIWGDGAMALVRASGLLEEFEETVTGTGENMVAICRVKRRGEKSIKHTFSVADAKKAGLWGKAVWANYPTRMLAMRPRSWCLRDAFADVLKGLRIAEEVMDTDMRDITPPSPPSPPPANGGPQTVRTVQPDASAPAPGTDVGKTGEDNPEPPSSPVESKPRTPPPAPKAEEFPEMPENLKRGPKAMPKVIEHDEDEPGTVAYDDRILDWEERLKAADRNTQEEIFESEIDPFREAGKMLPPDFNRLIGLIKDGERGQA